MTLTAPSPGWTLVLASASPARRATLRSAGVEPVVRVSSVDEAAVLARTGVQDAARVPLLLARAKAEDVAATLNRNGGADGDADGNGNQGEGGTVVLGCDSILDLDGVALGKPADPIQAVQRWQQMRGRSGQLRTGHWLIDLPSTAAGPSTATGPSSTAAGPSSTATGSWAAVGATSVTTVHFADLSDDEIQAYVRTGEPLNVAGAFTIDGLGGAFISGIEGDHHGVVGVSLPLLRELLGQLGVPWTALWTAGASVPA